MDPQRFEHLAEVTSRAVPSGSGFTLDAGGEDSDFVRFNHARVRQAGSVSQASAALRLVQGRRHASTRFTLSGDAGEDARRVARAVEDLAQMLPALPEDPHLLLSDRVCSTSQVDLVTPPEPEDVVDVVTGAARGTDFVGIYAGGTLWKGFANHLGQRNWFQSGGVLLDYSLVHSADKAVKASVGGKSWDPAAVDASLAESRDRLVPLARQPRVVPPGRYRAFLTPAAMQELVELMEWGGFSALAQRTATSPLQRLVSGEATLSPMLSIAEDTLGGMGPNFQEHGFVKPDRVPLIEAGRHVGSMVSPRTAAEYGLEPNADAHEGPNALAMSGGELQAEDILARLGTGVWVSNLWYLNYSDRSAARATGMTRFATFWVEDGQLVAPLSVMRFDTSLFDLFGPQLEALTSQVSFLPSASTYEARTTRSYRLPGALVSELPFTL